MCEIVTTGWLTTDDIVLTDRSYHAAVPGGGALYSAVGAQIWLDRVGVHSATGRDVYEETCAEIGARGLDTRGIAALSGPGLKLWLLHEDEIFKRQIPKLDAASADEMDAGRGPLPEAYAAAKGFHVAPQTPAGGAAALARLSRLPGRPVVTIDILSDELIDRRLYADMDCFRGASAFLPSEAEIERIWAPPDRKIWLRETAERLGAHMIAKLGARGSLCFDLNTRAFVHSPAYPAAVVDTTGAGDAYCGGFLAGLVAGRPVAECAAMGTVSASYVVEACGALQTARPRAAERDARLAQVLAGTTTEEAGR